MPRATRSTYNVAFRRRREGRTNYNKRLAFLKSGSTRLVARKTSNQVIVQLINYSPEGDKVITTVDNQKLVKMGWFKSKNLPTAYLSGYVAGKEAIKKGVKGAVLDLGRSTPTKSSFAFAVLKGAIDAGLDIPHSETVFDEDRFNGKHISEYAKKLKESDEELYKKRFSFYLKNKVDVDKIPELLDKMKSKM
jgi:large subunit ribosomal protein L18